MSRKKSIKHIDPGKNKLNYPIPDDHPCNSDYPILCFKYLCKKYHTNNCPPEHSKALIKRRCILSELGFKEINTSRRHAYGFEKIGIASLRFKIPEFISDEVDFLYAYRYKGKNPFLAHRRPDTNILHILAIDYNFSAYEHGK